MAPQPQPQTEYAKTNPIPLADYGTASNLTSYIRNIFESFKTARKPWETIWEECWYNYLGQYRTDLNWRKKTEGKGANSKIFIKISTLKCNTAHSKLIDVLFAGKGEVPFDLQGINIEKLGLDPEAAKVITTEAKSRLASHFKYIELEELLDTAILELTILGTGVVKGPIVERRKKYEVVQRKVGGIPVSELDNTVNPHELKTIFETVPVLDHIPLWEYYVDVNAKNTRDSIGEIHFQRLLPEKFRQLKNQGGYIKENVMEAARRATSTDPDDLRRIQLADNFMGEQGDKDRRVSTLEYWGLVPAQYLKEAGCELPDDVEEESDIEALVVLAADGIVCKACVNPFGRRPFYVCPYKARPGIIYGMGVAEAMRDSQKMINSSARMIIDNKALSGNGMVAVNLNRLDIKKTGICEVYPRKTWYVKGNFAPRDAIDSVTFADVTGGLRELMEMFERFADEETGMPKYTQGQQDSFLNKTAAGMSMLMTQSNINLKTVLKNIDNYWIEPIVEAFYSWFSNFEPDPNTPVINMKIVARGSDSLIAKELKMENYMKFMQITANPQDAIFMDRVKLMKNIARILETDDVMRTDEEIKNLMATMSQAANTPKDLREMLDIDRLYPYLARSEQMQILQQIGVKPDESLQGAITDVVPPGSPSAQPAPPELPEGALA